MGDGLIEIILFIFFQCELANNYIIANLMRHISHISQFNLRSTISSLPNRAAAHPTIERMQKNQKMCFEKSEGFIGAGEGNTHSFFVRITKQNLEEQNRIYKWRMNCVGNFVGIQNIKLQSEGNCYNPNLLFKIDLNVSKSNFVQVKDVCLTKCVSILKSVLSGVRLLLDYFDPIIFNQKMIYLNDDGTAKVWMDERFYINPNNQLYDKHCQYITTEDSLRSILAIFQSKCLKTKLSSKLFKILSQKHTLQQSLQALQHFENEQNLFPIQGLKNSTSTGTPIKTTSSIQFSDKNSKKRRERNDKNQINGEQKGFKYGRKNGNIATYKFLQAKSMQLLPRQIKAGKGQKQQQITYKSQQQKSEEVNQNKQNDKIFLNISCPSKSNISQSYVSSQIFHSQAVNVSQITKQKIDSSLWNQKIARQYQSDKKIQIDCQVIKKSQKMLQSCIVQGVNEKNPEEYKVNIILHNNGWNSIGSLFDRSRNIKQSWSEGKEQNIQLRNFKLKKLHTMGKQIKQSILPVGEEENQY